MTIRGVRCCGALTGSAVPRMVAMTTCRIFIAVPVRPGGASGPEAIGPVQRHQTSGALRNGRHKSVSSSAGGVSSGEFR